MKRTKTVINRIVAAIVAVMLSIVLLPAVQVKASDFIDTSRKASLTVVYIDADNEVAPNVETHIYLVATVDANGKYTITDVFKDYFEDQNFFNNGNNYDLWKDCISYDEDDVTGSTQLEKYIDEKGAPEAGNGFSDSKGEIVFDNLVPGIYYVRCGEKEKGNYVHSFIDFIYPVPILEMNADNKIVVNYNPSASPKKSVVGVLVHCSIRKRWVDAGNANKRPESVTFNIFCDGELMETVTLSSENNWYYEWSQRGLHDYYVEEVSKGAGYKDGIQLIKVGDHDYEYLCTNTYQTSEEPPGDNPPGDNPPGDNPPGDNPPGDNPPEENPPFGANLLPEVLGAVRELPAVLGARRLPQTGQLWWPLPILVIAGVVMIIIGIRKNSKKSV